MAKKIYKTLIHFEPDDGKLYPVDTIVHEHKKWLVPAWLEHPTGEWKCPVRIIFPGKGLYVPMHIEADYLLSNSHIPKSLFDGQSQPPLGSHFVVIEAPDIRF